MAQTSEFATMAPMIQRYFGSPSRKAAAAATVHAAKQMLGDAAAAATATAESPKIGSFMASSNAAAMQAASKVSPKSKNPSSPRFLMPKAPQTTFSPSSMLMRMRSDKAI